MSRADFCDLRVSFYRFQKKKKKNLLVTELHQDAELCSDIFDVIVISDSI